MKCGSFIFDGILARLSVAQARFCAVGQNPGHASEQAEVIAEKFSKVSQEYDEVKTEDKFILYKTLLAQFAKQ